MGSRARRMALATGLAASLLAVGCGSDGDAPDGTANKKTRAVMREIFNGIRVALPASADPDAFASPEHREEIEAALQILSRNAALLEKHSSKYDRQMRFLARSISRDASDAYRSFVDRRFDHSAYVLRQIAENCVVCHTRLPDLEDSAVAAGFVDEDEMEALSPESRATLQIATRRFDEALTTLDELLADPDTHPAVMLGPLTDYLVVSIRVKGDFDRPTAMLERFVERDDLWPSLKQDVQGWLAELPELRGRLDAPPSVASARALVERADAADVEGDGQSGLLDYVVASAILERFIDGHRTEDPQLGEAFFWLGTLEARIGRNYWVTPAPFLLEEAVRLAPGAPFAAESIAILERELRAAYEGSDIEELPEEDLRRLEELRALAEAARAE